MSKRRAEAPFDKGRPYINDSLADLVSRPNENTLRQLVRSFSK
jgi:hypothetical protein